VLKIDYCTVELSFYRPIQQHNRNNIRISTDQVFSNAYFNEAVGARRMLQVGRDGRRLDVERDEPQRNARLVIWRTNEPLAVALLSGATWSRGGERFRAQVHGDIAAVKSHFNRPTEGTHFCNSHIVDSHKQDK